MLKFFRNIRHNLAAHNRFRNYTLYALGEIILVVIGILIALQINNWNESRKERKREKMYLESLQSDLQESQSELRRVIKKTDTIATNQLLDYSIDAFQMPAARVFDSLILKTFGYTIAMTNEGKINDISGSGDLKVIRNDSLRRMIASWNAGFKMIREREDLLKEAFDKNRNYLDRQIDLFNLRLDKNLMDEETRKYIVNNNEYRNRFIDLIRNAMYTGIRSAAWIPCSRLPVRNSKFFDLNKIREIGELIPVHQFSVTSSDFFNLR